MDEATTRMKKIDPALRNVGWDEVPQSEILVEQSAYIAPGMVSALPQNRHPKKADYILEYKKKKLAVIEAKSDEKSYAEGIPQAKLYAELLHIRFTYATNGNEIWQIDMGVKDALGNYIIPSTEGFVDKFPSPQELWQMTYPEQNEWRDKFNLCALNRGGGREPRYYQEIAIDSVLNAVANNQKRILLTMATGTGKTYTAFQICWKLYQTNWNTRGTSQKPRILFITDRNILANQAKNDFEQFDEDAMERITADRLRATSGSGALRGKLPTARHLYFTIFQTIMGCPEGSETPYYMQWPRDFFDFIIIDECHRGGANDESEWRKLMEWFDAAVQLGMTATPRRKVNANTYNYFGEPVYSYSLKQGIEDGFLTPYRVRFATSYVDTYSYNPYDSVVGEIEMDKTYTEKDFYHGNIYMRERDEHRVKELLNKIDPNEKTIVFCASQVHALEIAAMINQHKKVPDSNYCERVTADDGDKGEQKLREFQNNVEFKQIMGRGTRLFDGKYFFTLYDFVGASKNFQDPEWDGDPFCPVCGNYPCSCHQKPPKPCPKCGKNPCECPPPPPPEPCPICGHQPCTCPGGGKPKSTVIVKLSPLRSLTLLQTHWEERVQFGDELITIEEYVKRLFGELPKFLDGVDDLRERWANPETRQQLLNLLEQSGFQEEKLNLVRRFLQMEQCDLLDVLSYLAYNTTPLEKSAPKPQQDFADFIMQLYVRNGFRELGNDKLGTLIDMKYHTISDAKAQLGMDPAQMRSFFLTVQHELYNGPAVNAATA